MDAWLQSFKASNTGNLVSYCFGWLVVLFRTSHGDTLVWHYFDAFSTDRKGMQSKLRPSKWSMLKKENQNTSCWCSRPSCAWLDVFRFCRMKPALELSCGAFEFPEDKATWLNVCKMITQYTSRFLLLRIVICSVQFLWMTSIHLAPHRPLNVTAADFLSSVTGKEHPANPWNLNKDQDETVHVFSLCTVIISPISFTLAGCLQDSDETKAEQHPFCISVTLIYDHSSHQTESRRHWWAQVGSVKIPAQIGFRAFLHPCNRIQPKIASSFFDTTYTTCCHLQSTFWSHQSYVVAVAGPEVLVAPGKSLRIKQLLTNTAKITKGWHAM